MSATGNNGKSRTAPPLRIGAIGVADILRETLIDTRAHETGTVFHAIASRSLDKARTYAEQHSIPRYYGSYDELLADPEVDLVYNPLPNGMHAEWSIRAMRAGKPVLCQKPLASNAEEAERMVAVARETGQLLMEAWHYRHQPVAKRIGEIMRSGVLGRLRRIDVHFQVPGKWVTAGPDNIRFNYDLAGGVAMDPGCYCVNLLRYVAGEEPRVLRAKARVMKPRIDSAMEADLVFPSGCEGHLLTSLDYEGDNLDEWLKVTGEHGELEVIQPCMPHWGEHFIHLRLNGQPVRTEQLDKTSGFVFLLRDMVGIVRDGAPVPTTAEDAVHGMRVIDALYTAAGLTPRGT